MSVTAEADLRERITQAVDRFGTPLWVLDAARVAENLLPWQRAVADPGADVFYSVKANPAPALLELVVESGLGLDAASAFDVVAAHRAGVSPDRVTFCSKAPGADDLEAALECGTVVAGNADQLALWASVGRRRLGLRINPGVSAGFHDHVRTGPAGRRFGEPIDGAADAIGRARQDGLTIDGLHCHLGSDILETSPHLRVADQLLALATAVGGIEWINLGRGYGVAFPGETGVYDVDALVAQATERAAASPGAPQVRFEPGTHISRDAGWLVTRVTTSVATDEIAMLECDASVNHLPGALLYGTQHPVVVVASEASAGDEYRSTLVSGNLMQPGDVLATAARLPRLASGDLIAFGLAGAYTSVRSTTFNGRPLPAEVWLDGPEPRLVRSRRTAEELLTETYR